MVLAIVSNFYRVMTPVHKAILPKWHKFGTFCHQVLILDIFFIMTSCLGYILDQKQNFHVQRYQNEIAMDQFESIFEQNFKFVASKKQ